MEHETFSALSETQNRACSALTSALASNRLHHAYILVGRETSTLKRLAHALAQRLVCETPNEQDACGECAGCRKIMGGNHVDVSHVQPNEKNRLSIDVIRKLNAHLGLRATDSLTKVIIIERADCMNAAAQNALLKTLEEPPGNSCFILTTTRYRGLLPTVRSRSQALRLAPDSIENARALVKEAGVPDGLSTAVARLVGPDSDSAQRMMELGLEDIAQTVKDALTSKDVESALDAASDLGRDRNKADLALALVELWIRDRLASRLIKADGDPRAAQEKARLCASAERLVELRRLSVFNLNTTLALESVFLTIRGEAQP